MYDNIDGWKYINFWLNLFYFIFILINIYVMWNKISWDNLSLNVVIFVKYSTFNIFDLVTYLFIMSTWVFMEYI